MEYLVLFSNSCYDKIYDTIKYLSKKSLKKSKIKNKKGVLQIVLIIILQESELIHIILYLLKKY